MGAFLSPIDRFSPYSRGWSLYTSVTVMTVWIFPVFAGMVPPPLGWPAQHQHFPRIRGDGPPWRRGAQIAVLFSPYSRGWSLLTLSRCLTLTIFPVFAGMVPTGHPDISKSNHFPRIRGDGPSSSLARSSSLKFSPYSRGWSGDSAVPCKSATIFPVFAGMVPRQSCPYTGAPDFPRIRGDGPMPPRHVDTSRKFSPYSRGWSL